MDNIVDFIHLLEKIMKRIFYTFPLAIISIAGIFLNMVYYNRYFLNSNYGINLSWSMAATFIFYESALWFYANKKYYLNILKIAMIVFSILVTLSSQFNSTSEKKSNTAKIIYQKTDISGDVEYYRNRIKTLDNRIDEYIKQQLIFGSERNRTERENAETEKKELESKLEKVMIKKKSDIENINTVKSIYYWFSHDLPRIFNSGMTEEFVRVLFQLFSSIILALMAPVSISMIKNYKKDPIRKEPIIKLKKEKKRHNLREKDIDNIITMLLFIKGKMLSAADCADKFKIVNEKKNNAIPAYKKHDIELVRNEIINQGLTDVNYKFAIDKMNKGKI